MVEISLIKDSKIDDDILYTLFKNIDKDELYEYIILMKNVDENLIYDVYKKMIEMNIEDSIDMKVVINQFYKNVKKYKDILLIFDNESMGIKIIDMYDKYLESKKLNNDIIRYIIHILYNIDILEEESIINWYKTYSKKSKLLDDFIKWLETS